MGRDKSKPTRKLVKIPNKGKETEIGKEKYEIETEASANEFLQKCFEIDENTKEYPYGPLLTGDNVEDLGFQDGDKLNRFLDGEGECKDTLDVLKKFYLGGVRKGHSLGQRALLKKNNIELAKKNQYPRSMKQDYYIEFLKYCSSYTPLLKGTERTRTGGGYFLCLGGYGVVVDPGYQFLEKFYERNYSLSDINAVIVTHYHADHYADLPALLALFHKLYSPEITGQVPERTIAIYIDQITKQMFAPMLDKSGKKNPHLAVHELKNEKSHTMRSDIILRTLPTSHPIPGGKLDSGVGLDFEIIKKDKTITRLIITGDTAWNDDIKDKYKKRALSFASETMVVLVAHMSTVDKNEILSRMPPYSSQRREFFYDKHLALAGVCGAIEALKPQKVAVSEIGEEIYDCIDELCVMLRDAFSLKKCVGANMSLKNPMKL